ncbi:hypothetical protein C0Q70_20823 [Pomacea canaliculata]|uniref:HotDog ACOT-type domain-containing protein n=1 Tax=Pomacea canaliculata TaxID=400727 RepID=A0A2T7NAS5_POMCA|nr:hypothetical protein C0Q70_20823 [Pomacea canaliculata]
MSCSMDVPNPNLQGAASIPDSQQELPARSMHDSYQELVIPLGHNTSLRENYMTVAQRIRFGRILEDLDLFAVLICYTHNLIPGGHRVPLPTVTALVDRIELLEYHPSPYKDLLLCGQVTWVGTSSMEVTMEVRQEDHSLLQKVMTARFVMAARHPITEKAAMVNPLKPDGPREEYLYKLGERSKIERNKRMQMSLMKVPPSDVERDEIHQLYLQTTPKENDAFETTQPENAVWMKDTKLMNMVICQPEERNMYNRIFGGFLMRMACELAWANASRYCRSRSLDLEILDHVIFLNPVEIGSLLLLSSKIVYTESKTMQVKVHAEVLDPETTSTKTTNYFFFTFNGPNDVPRVWPHTYEEFMLYLEGKRHIKYPDLTAVEEVSEQHPV